jgi:hypothetical protein
MCSFFSFLSDGNGNFFYFNNEQRKLIQKRKLYKDNYLVEEQDSHSTIARFYKGNASEDKMNKFEYNPLTKVFVKDQINTVDDSCLALAFCQKLDFKTICDKLVIKNIENPLDVELVEVTDFHIMLLKRWASVGDSVGASVGDSVGASVRDSVWDSVRASVWASVWDSVRASVWASVWDSVGASVWDSVRASVWASVRDSVWDSVRASVWAYISSFTELEKEEWKYCEKIDFQGLDNPFQSCIDLWELGLVPSFDGLTWRLHAGKKAVVVFSISKIDLEEYEA